MAPRDSAAETDAAAIIRDCVAKTRTNRTAITRTPHRSVDDRATRARADATKIRRIPSGPRMWAASLIGLADRAHRGLAGVIRKAEIRTIAPIGALVW